MATVGKVMGQTDRSLCNCKVQVDMVDKTGGQKFEDAMISFLSYNLNEKTAT